MRSGKFGFGCFLIKVALIIDIIWHPFQWFFWALPTSIAKPLSLPCLFLILGNSQSHKLVVGYWSVKYPDQPNIGSSHLDNHSVRVFCFTECSHKKVLTDAQFSLQGWLAYGYPLFCKIFGVFGVRWIHLEYPLIISPSNNYTNLAGHQQTKEILGKDHVCTGLLWIVVSPAVGSGTTMPRRKWMAPGCRQDS